MNAENHFYFFYVDLNNEVPCPAASSTLWRIRHLVTVTYEAYMAALNKNMRKLYRGKIIKTRRARALYRKLNREAA